MVYSYQFWDEQGPYIIDPFARELVNITSVDLRLGRCLLLQRYEGQPFNDELALLQDDGRLLLEDGRVLSGIFQPGDSVLAHTLETLNVPNTIRLQGMLKSSVARAGLNHRTALYIDPGFQGQLTLELLFDREGILVPGKRIIQVEAQQVDYDVPPSRSYDGHYQGSEGVVPNQNPDIAFVPYLAAGNKA